MACAPGTAGVGIACLCGTPAEGGLGSESGDDEGEPAMDEGG